MGVTTLDCRVDGASIDTDGGPASWRFNTTIAGLEQADSILLVGTNPRIEAPIINARIRKVWLTKKIKIQVIGEKIDLNYPYEYLGAGAESLNSYKSAGERPAIILGMGALQRADGAAILALARSKAVVNDGWNGFNVLHTAASRVGSLMLGFTPPKGEKNCDWKAIKAVWLHGVDSAVVNEHIVPKDAFVIYQGHHGDAGAARADVIFPGCAYTEKNATYVNTEGRVQLARAAVTPLGQAKEDWKIIRAFSEVVGKPLSYNTLADLRAALIKDYPDFAHIDDIAPAKWNDFGKAGKCDDAPFKNTLPGYYQTDVISRASVTMAECVEEFINKDKAAA
ncbi:MAG TPA: molybdopterin-dependent oxidoreductase, partial [Alphaproteobacteria bacterium]